MTAASITLFSSNTAPTGPQLDNNFLAYAVFTTIPCSVAGTNALTLTQNSNTPTLTQLTNYIQFSAVALNTNTGAVTITHPSFGTLNAYKDSPVGPVALSGDEIVQDCAFTMRYNSALDGGSGGYHIYSNTGYAGGTITGNTTIAAGATLSVAGPASLTSLLVGASATPLLRIISGLATVTYSVTSANAVQSQTFALAGAQVNDSVSLGMGTDVPSGVGFAGFVSGAGTITARLLNPSTVTIAAATITMRATALGFV